MAKLASQDQVFFFQAALLNGIAHQDNDFFEGKRLLDEIEGAELRGPHGRLDGVVAGDHDDRRRVRQRLNAAQGFEAVDPGEPNVEKYNLETAKRGTFQRFFGRSHGIYLVTFIFEN